MEHTFHLSISKLKVIGERRFQKKGFNMCNCWHTTGSTSSVCHWARYHLSAGRIMSLCTGSCGFKLPVSKASELASDGLAVLSMVTAQKRFEPKRQAHTFLFPSSRTIVILLHSRQRRALWCAFMNFATVTPSLRRAKYCWEMYSIRLRSPME